MRYLELLRPLQKFHQSFNRLAEVPTLKDGAKVSFEALAYEYRSPTYVFDTGKARTDEAKVG